MANRNLPPFRNGILSGACRVALLVVAVTAVSCAHTSSTTTRSAAEASPGYLTSSDNQVVRSGGGECVRTGFWQPDYATRECDPALVAEATPAPPQEPPEVTRAPEPTPAPEQTAAVPSEPEPQPVQPQQVYVGADAFFGFNEAELAPKAKGALDRIVERARDAEEVRVTIVGYADQLGPEDYNLSLSQRRAEAVQGYLLEQGVPPSAVSVEARGEGDPIVSCEGRRGEALIECLQPNRRTEITVSLQEAPEPR